MTTEIIRYIHIGLLCVQENVADRPTMASVVLMLSSYSITLPTPSKPAWFKADRAKSTYTSFNKWGVSHWAISLLVFYEFKM